MNTNDFSKCKVGDSLYCFLLGQCKIIEIHTDSVMPIEVESEFGKCRFPFDGTYRGIQLLFFSEPQVIAPPEPPRLPDYKIGQWIAVWDDGLSAPNIRRFLSVSSRGFVLSEGSTAWDHHCTLEELPAVLKKWGK